MTGAAPLLGALPPRLASKIEVVVDGCWLWNGALNRNGYGRTTRTNSRKVVVAHRYVYELLIGAIPDGLNLDHLCRVRNCVNPDHLEPVTQRVNLLRGETIVASAAAAIECPNGHPYAGDNLYVSPKGHRFCRACHRARVAAARAANPEKMRAQSRAADARYRAKRRAPKSGEGWKP